MTDRNIKVGVEVDASSADQGLDKLANKAQSTSKIIKKAGEDAGKGFSKVGEGSEQASEKIDRTSKSIIQSIQRTTVALESGGRTTAKYYETIANQRGVSVDALRPYLEQLKAVETAQGKFTQSSGAAVNSLNKVGISAAQTAAAMRNVPAQFTDIVTSLQGGQAPLTVLLQQGGQLKDMFGGIGNAAGALGKYMLGLISPFTLLAGAAVAVGVAYNQGSKEAQEFNKSLVLTGNAAGTTTNQLMDMAKAISSSGASTQGAAAEALAALAGTGKVGVENLQRFASVAVQTQKIVGISVQDTAKAFSDLAKSPLESALRLDEQYNFLTVSIYKQIKALQDQGDTIEAAKVAQNAYADALAQRTAGIEQNLGSIERGWMAIKNGAKSAWDAMLGVGRDTTESERIEQLQRNIANRADFISRERPQSLLIPKAQADNAKDQAELNLLLKKTEQKKIQGELDAKAIALKNAGIEFDRQGEKYLSSALKLENEIAKARKLGADAGLDEKQINDRVAAIRKEYAEKNKKTQQEETLASQVAFIERKKLRDAEKEMEKQFSDDIKQFSQEQVKRNKEVTDSLINQITRQDRAYFGIIEQQDAYRQSLQDNADLMQLEASLMGQSATDRNTAIEQYKIEIALQKELLKIKQDVNLSKAQKDELSDTARENANIAKSQAALKVQQDEWSKFYADIYNGLTDSLYRGFEAGKGFFQSFWDGIKNLFKTTVLKLAVQGVMGGIVGSIPNIAQAFSGAESASNAGSLIGIGKTIYDGFAGGFTGFGDTVSKSVQAALDKAGLSMSGGTPGAFAQGAGTVASYGAGIAAGVYGGRAISGGYSVTGGNALVNVGTAAGAFFGGPIGAAIGGSISGGINRLFGMKAAELQYSELSGSVGASGFMATTRDVFKAEGGLFRSDKWSETKTPLADTTGLTAQYEAIAATAKSYADLLGLSTASLASFSKSFTFNLSKTGDAAKDAEANQKLINDLFVGITNDITNLLAPSISAFGKEGETASQTLQRLATSLTGVNAVMKSVGFAEFSKSLEGANAAARLAELTGGIEKLATGAQYFFENFLTDAEKIKPSADLVTDTMKRLGQSSVDTIDEFKMLVQGLDLATESGAKMYAELIAIAPQFKAVADFAKQSAEEIKKAEEEKTKVIQQGNADRAALLANRRAADLAQQAIKKAADDAFKTLSDSVASGMQNLIRAGDAGAAVASQMSISGIKTGDFATSSGYNSAAAAAQAKIAKGLMGSASFDALNVQDVSRFMSGLMSFIFADDVQNSIKSELAKSVNLPEQGLIGQTISDLLTAEARDYTNKNMLARGSGIDGVMAAQLDLSFASYHGRGADVEAYNTAVIGLSDLLKGGKITQDEYATSLASVNKLVGDSIGLMRDESAQRERIIGAQNALKEAGISSIAFYFEQIGKSVEELNKVAAETAAPLSQVTSAIGRLTSISDVFGMSANAAGGKDSGITSVENAQLVASAAAIAAGVITSADAAQAAKLLADKSSFAGVDKTSIRDISLIFEGLKQFDAKSFENSFMRMNDALNKGIITQDQYQDIFDQSLSTYQGLDSVTKQVAESMDNLRKSMGGFADQLLIDSQKTTLSQALTMDELMRQYEVAKVAAMTGEAGSVNKFQGLANQVLDASKYGSRAEYNAAFGAVYRDARNLESIGARSAQGENVVTELKNLNKSQTERIDRLEDALLAALVQIAKNTKDTVNTLELAEIP